MVVDAVAPEPGLVLDGLATRLEVDFTPAAHVYTGHWMWWLDHETSIRYYEASLGTLPGADDAHDWLNVGTDTQVHFSFGPGEQLVHGMTYYLNVRATDDAGHRAMASSDGITVDTTPATTGGVLHGLATGTASAYTAAMDTFQLQWDGIVDPEVRWRAAL